MEYLPNVLVFGHSFIKRLERKTQADQSILKSEFGFKQCKVTLKGYGGLNFGLEDQTNERKLYDIVDNLFRNHTFDIVVCQLGGNDISCSTSPDALKDATCKFSEIRTHELQCDSVLRV